MQGPSVLIIGCGDAGMKIAAGLLERAAVSRLTLADSAPERIRMRVDMMACCYPAKIRLQALDGTRHREVEACIRASQPDLIVQSASLISPWSIIGRAHPLAHALSAAGIAVQLPAQLPVLTTVMTVVKDLGGRIPVANLSMPDITHTILAGAGLEPVIGLGNVSILHLRARAALLARSEADNGDIPLLRIVGHHHHVYDVMQCRPPPQPDKAPRVYIGEQGIVDRSVAYGGTPFPPGPIYNVITAAAALPVICGLLPEAKPLRFSAPAPMGLPGGYPVRIDNGAVSLDLPAGVELDETIEFNRSMGVLDGIERISVDGVVEFSQHARDALSAVAPELTEPLRIENLPERTTRLLSIVRQIT